MKLEGTYEEKNLEIEVSTVFDNDKCVLKNEKAKKK